LDYAAPIGQWDSRLVDGRRLPPGEGPTPAVIQREPVAWIGTHRHDADGLNEPYQFTLLFRMEIPLPSGTKALRLPEDGHLRVMAATAVRDPDGAVKAAQPLYDRAARSAVEIVAPSRDFVDSLTVVLRSPNLGARIRYTLDGSDPGTEANEYAGPVTLRRSATLKARAFAPGLDDSYGASAVFRLLEPRPPVAVKSPHAGLRCLYYEGAWGKLPDFGALEALRSGVEEIVGLPEDAREEDIGRRFEGYLRVPADGAYRLHLRSDDGSRLWLHGELVVDSDGLHGEDDASAIAALQAGTHPLRVDFFQHLGGRALSLWVEGPGMELREAPADWLVHDGP